MLIVAASDRGAGRVRGVLCPPGVMAPRGSARSAGGVPGRVSNRRTSGSAPPPAVSGPCTADVGGGQRAVDVPWLVVDAGSRREALVAARAAVAAMLGVDPDRFDVEAD